MPQEEKGGGLIRNKIIHSLAACARRRATSMKLAWRFLRATRGPRVIPKALLEIAWSPGAGALLAARKQRGWTRSVS